MSGGYETIVVLDFEATCRPKSPPVPQEIIEFPSVLVSLADLQVLDSFTAFVRPVHHPQLDPFCTELTGIRQEDVDGADAFPEVLARHRAWLDGHGLLDRDDAFAFVTCGDWDLAAMLPTQCGAADISIAALPAAYRRWINVKKIFAGVVRKSRSDGMVAMLRALGLELQGRHHRGIDDCHNIARICLALAERGAPFEITSKLGPSQYPELPLTLRCGDGIEAATLRKRSLSTLLGLASGLFRVMIDRVVDASGAEVTDASLCELAPNSELRALRRGESLEA